MCSFFCSDYNHLNMPDVASVRLRNVSSRQNALVRELRQAFSQGQAVDRLCAIEGMRMIEEAIRSRLKVHALFVRESAQAKAQRIIDQLSKRAEAILLPDNVFDSAVLTESPQGIAALVQVKEYDLASVLATSPALVVVAAAIQDPGNLGTVVRSAEAFGATAVVGTEGTVGQWNPKTVRASAGSMFRLPVMKAQTQQLIVELRQHQIRALALIAPRGDEQSFLPEAGSRRNPQRLQDADLTGDCALFVGNEGSGLPRELLDDIDEFVAIPQTRVESLNAGVAASIALYEVQRQRSVRK